jgi:hypothetical protein
MSPIESLPLSEVKEVRDRIIGIAPKDWSDALQAIWRSEDNAVCFPLLRSKNIGELDLQLERLFPEYVQLSEISTSLVQLILRENLLLLESYMREGHARLQLFLESQSEGKLSDEAALNSFAALKTIGRIVERMWERLRAGLPFKPASPDTQAQCQQFSASAWLFLKCIIFYLNGNVITASQTVLDEMAYRARQNARSWYALFAELDKAGRTELQIPADLESDEEDRWLAEAGLEEWANHLDH